MSALPRPDPKKPLTPSPRIRDPEKLRAVYYDLFEADRFANQDRAAITDEFSGGLPWEYSELEERGQADIPNVNWGVGEQQLRAHISTFCNLVRSGEQIAKVYLKPELDLTFSQRVNYASIMGQEFHKLNTKTPAWRMKFKSRIEQGAREYVYFGAAFAFFEDAADWRFQMAGLNKVKLQRAATYDGPDSTETVFMRREYTAAELVEPLRHGEKAAKRAGWNVEALKAATGRIMERYGFRQDLETFVHEVKNNDLYYRSGRAETIPILHSFVQEFDGKYSWYIFTEEALGGPKVKIKNEDGSTYEVEPWLFKKEFAFNDGSDVLIPFLMEVGTGELHSVRGTGHRLFEIDVNRNRLTNMMLNGCVQSGIPQYQSTTEDAHEGFAIYQIGGGQVIPAGFTYIDKKTPDLSASLVSGMKLLQTTQAGAAGVFNQRQAGNEGGTSAEASETRAITDENIILNQQDKVNWMEPLAVLYTAQWRRITKAKATDKGGLLATEMVKRCCARGVPLEVVRNGVDYLEPMLGVFVPGTTKSQEEQIEMLTKISGMLPDAGREQVNRAMTIAIAGPQNVDSLNPVTPSGPNIEAQMAMLENGFLSKGDVWPVSKGQDHLAHALQHAKVMDPTLGYAMQGLQSGNVQASGMALAAYGALVQHYGAHVSALAKMPSPPPQFKSLDEILKANQRTFKQLTRVANAQAERQKKEQAKAMQKAAQNGGMGGPGQPTLEEVVALKRAETQRQIALEDAATDREIKKQKAQDQRDANQIKTVQKVQNSDMITDQKLTHMQRQNVVESGD
jgi:hypothetical protein